jgi:hypothetical protein
MKKIFIIKINLRNYKTLRKSFLSKETLLIALINWLKDLMIKLRLNKLKLRSNFIILDNRFKN